ncbi:MAG: hypothetical protein LBS75_04630 [Synergistaceae bacterium]|nr:hypothetical protein [Synergistaceae bacterium]
MSRAFVREDDSEIAGLKYDSDHSRKTVEWLRIQEKKLDFLLNDPKGQAIEAQKRGKWIADARSAIAAAREELGRPG